MLSERGILLYEEWNGAHSRREPGPSATLSDMKADYSVYSLLNETGLIINKRRCRKYAGKMIFVYNIAGKKYMEVPPQTDEDLEKPDWASEQLTFCC